jgi:hypothetical protein
VHKDCDKVFFKKVWWKKEISTEDCGREGKPVDLIQREDVEEQGLESSWLSQYPEGKCSGDGGQGGG